jgi:CHAT domain-containing protein/Tfp pilus assembly protein PilF
MRMSLWTFALLLSFLSTTAAQPAESTPATQLRVGAPLSRTLAGGDVHRYQIAAEKGDAFRVAIEQRGIDVVARVTGPEGTLLLESDDPTAGPFGPQGFTFVASDAGIYGLEVAPAGPAAEPGAYEVALLWRRPATGDDARRVQIESMVARASRLVAEGSAASMRSGIAELTQAVDGWRALGDREQETAALLQLGEVHDALNETDSAESAYRDALKIARGLESRRSEGNALNDLGLLLLFRGDAAGALELLQAARPLAERLGDRQLQIAIENNIAAVLTETGETQQAVDHLQRALELNQKPTVHWIASAINAGLSRIYLDFRHFAKSLEYATAALAAARKDSNREAVTVGLHNLGDTLWASGETERGVALLRQALDEARATGNTRAEAMTLLVIGSIQSQTGQAGEAVESYQKALAIFEATKNPISAAVTMSSLAEAYRLRGDLDQAEPLLQRALALHVQHKNPAGESLARLRLAHIEQARGHLESANTLAREGLRLLELQRTKLDDAAARAQLFAFVRHGYELAVRICLRLHQQQPGAGHDRAALEISERGRARVFLDALAEAQVDVHNDADPALLERQRGIERKLHVASQRRQRLSRAAPESELRSLEEEIERLLSANDEAWAEIRRRHPGHAALLRPEPLSFDQIRSLLDPDTVLLEFQLGDEGSALWAVTSDGLTTAALPPRAEIEADVRRLRELLTARNKAVRFETQDEGRRRVADADAALVDAARRLSAVLLEPAAEMLRGRRLIVVPDGALHYLPFAALPEPGQGDRPPLVAGHEIVTLPSSSVLAVLRSQAQGRPRPPLDVMVLADPVFARNDPRLRGAPVGPALETGHRVREMENDLVRAALSTDGTGSPPRLPGTRREADGIVTLAGAGRSRAALDFDASRTTALSPSLGEFRVIHFATHGLLDTRSPRLSGLVLSLVDATGRAQDGFLRLSDLYNLRLNADLVVLSACETALGGEIRGEGIVGLTRGFMHAGAQRVLATLWRVDDAATAELMQLFYRGLLQEKLRPAAALQEAQRALARQARWKSPYYWSGFVLQGEPR